MKILMTVMMTLMVTSVFASDCTLGGACNDAAKCSELKGEFAESEGKCFASKEKEAKCSDIVTSQAGKTTEAAGKEAVGGGAANTREH